MHLLYLLFALLAVALVLGKLFRSRPGIDLARAQAAVKAGSALLVDVREPDEWRDGVARHAALLPWSDLRGGREQWRPFLEQNPGKQLLLYCRSGTRAGLAVAQLRGEGFDAVNAGSLRAWDRTHWPICTPKGLR